MRTLCSAFHRQVSRHDSDSSPTWKPKSANIFILFSKRCLLTDTSSKKRINYTKKNSIYSTCPIAFCIKLFSFNCMSCLSGSVSRGAALTSLFWPVLQSVGLSPRRQKYPEHAGHQLSRTQVRFHDNRSPKDLSPSSSTRRCPM